jgi:hypothetical protein
MLGAGVLYLMFRDRTAPALPPGSSMPAAPLPSSGGGCPGSVIRTGGRDTAFWYLTRMAATIDDLVRRGVDPVGAEHGAQGLVAQWAHETNAGRSEYNFNLGGWVAAPGEPCHELPDGTTGRIIRWASFPSLERSVHEHIDRLQRPRFRPAFLKWIESPTDEQWIRALGAAGYYEASPDAYAAAWRVRLKQLREMTRAAA